MHTEELTTLKDNLKRARKLLATSPRDLREEREKEVQRLEKAMKRTESLVNKDRREKIEQEALGKVAAEEKAKRKEGKGAWYLKQCEYYAFSSSISFLLFHYPTKCMLMVGTIVADKKEMLLRAKYDALAATGGSRAVKKAMEKKQKKIGQKEKKRRPFAAAPPPPSSSATARAGGQGGASFGERRAAKRQSGGDDGPRTGKRRKFA